MTKARRRVGTVVVIVVVVAVAMLAGGVIGRNLNAGGNTASPTPRPSVGQPSATPPIPTEGGYPLPMSSVMVSEGGTDEIYGMPIGYPKTMSGAVQAMINYNSAIVSPAILIPEQSDAIQNYMFSDPERREALGFRESTSEKIRAALELNDQAQPVADDGELDKSRKLYYAAYPEYGAFRIVDAKPSVNSHTPDEVRVQVWKPTVGGCVEPGTREGMTIKFGITDYTVRWFNGDWHQVGNELIESSSEPQPEDLSSPIVSFEERARLLPAEDGWMLPGNASEQPIDRLEFPVELG